MNNKKWGGIYGVYRRWLAQQNNILNQFNNMGKHKLIHKYGQFRPDRPLSHEKFSDSSSQEDRDLEDLQEVDCNRFFFAEQEEPYSIEDVVDSLGAQEGEPQEESDPDFSYGYAYFGASDLQRVNANYHRLMCVSEESEEEGYQTRVRFTQRIHVKFFDLERPVVQVCDAEQYTTPTFQQYSQTEEDVEVNQ